MDHRSGGSEGAGRIQIFHLSAHTLDNFNASDEKLHRVLKYCATIVHNIRLSIWSCLITGSISFSTLLILGSNDYQWYSSKHCLKLYGYIIHFYHCIILLDRQSWQARYYSSSYKSGLYYTWLLPTPDTAGTNNFM